MEEPMSEDTKDAVAEEVVVTEQPTEAAQPAAAETEAKAEENTVEDVDPFAAAREGMKKGADAIRKGAGTATEQVKKLPKKVLYGILGAVALLVLIVLIASCAGGGNPNRTVDYGKNFFYQLDNYTLVNLNGDQVETDERIRTVENSADASATVYLDSEDTLYLVTAKGEKKIADDVDSFVISMYGDTVAYVTEAENSIGELYLYRISKGKATKIDKDVYTEDIVLSPDGGSIAYIGGCETTDDWFDTVSGDLYVSKKGKSGEKQASDAVPCAITKNAKQVYYIKDSKLYVNDEKIASDISSYATLAFNQDNTEMLYLKDGNTYYYTLKAGEPVRLKTEAFRNLLLPENTVSNGESLSSMEIFTYGVKSFNKQLMNLEGSIYYVTDKGENVVKIDSGIKQSQVSEDGKSLLYVDYSGTLHYVKNVHKSTEDEEIGDDLDIDSFYASKDLGTIYYVSDGELYYLKKDKGVRVTDEVDDVVYSDKFGVVYYICDGELYFAKKTSKSKEKLIGEEVLGFGLIDDEVVFIYDKDGEGEEYTFYKMTGKNKMKELATVER